LAAIASTDEGQKMHRVLVLALVVALLPAHASAAQGRLRATVVSIINGGTIQVQIESGPIVTVRLLGVDAPDTRSPGQTVQCFEAEATAKVAELLPIGSAVGLERDIQDSDQYGRIPAYVWPVDDEPMVNERLITEGYVRVRTESMNVRYDANFMRAEQHAQANGFGLWSTCADGSGDPGDAADPCAA
jgi:micrococcal nuclease